MNGQHGPAVATVSIASLHFIATLAPIMRISRPSDPPLLH